MARRQLIFSALAALALAGCEKPAPVAPIDEARAAIQARYGNEFDIALVAVEEDKGHRVVCGLLAQEGPPTWPAKSFLVVDGIVVEQPYTGPVAEVANRCVASLPSGPPIPGGLFK